MSAVKGTPHRSLWTKVLHEPVTLLVQDLWRMYGEMITKQLLKDAIDHVQDEYLEALYTIIRACGLPAHKASQEHLPAASPGTETEGLDWQTFIQETYGCLADDLITRGDQGTYEKREEVA